jgi:DNA polymerase-3 subunit epsilon
MALAQEAAVCRSADFLAVDVETANSDPASICSIGLVHFKAGEVIRQLKVLLNPEDRFDPMNVSIHGITPDQVTRAPTMRAMFPMIASALSTTIVVHHTHFDRTALTRAADRSGYPAPQCTWLDSAIVVRHTWERFAKRGFGLENLAAEFGISFKHHDPCEDARVAGLILLRAMTVTGLTLSELHARIEELSAQREGGDGAKAARHRAG